MSDTLAAEHESQSEEEEDFMAGGDLGEGFGRKPGGLYEGSGSPIAQNLKLRKSSDARGAYHYHPVKKGEDCVAANNHVRKYSNSDDTSTPKHGTEGYARGRQNSTDANSDVSNEDHLRQRLQELTEEVDFLRIELEASHRQLGGKDEALKILQNMAVFDKATSHTKVMLQKAEEQRRALEKEINVLQWEIEFDQVRLKNLEETWKEKYDRVYCENAALKETLEIRTSEVKTLKSENTLLNQQCQEIIAMLDVKEQKMFQDNVSLDKSSLTEVTALELAVLGACTCSSAGVEPCSCAKMSAATRKQLLQLRQEFEVERKSKEEAYIMADAFRIAFEQQLKRQNDQTLPLNDMERLCKKGSKRLNNWKRLKENGLVFSKDRKKSLGQKLMDMLISSDDCKKLEALDEPQEILRILIDLLNDKEEALAHQRKVSYMLARSMEDKVQSTKSKTQEENSGSDSTAGNHQHNCTNTRQRADLCTCSKNTTSHGCLCLTRCINPREASTSSLETSFSSLLKEICPQGENAETFVTNASHEEQPAEAEQSETQSDS